MMQMKSNLISQRIPVVKPILDTEKLSLNTDELNLNEWKHENLTINDFLSTKNDKRKLDEIIEKAGELYVSKQSSIEVPKFNPSIDTSPGLISPYTKSPHTTSIQNLKFQVLISQITRSKIYPIKKIFL